MKFTNEQLSKAKAAKSAEELLALAKENGVELTEDEASKYFAELNAGGELADDELENVSGGCGNDDDGPKPMFSVGQYLFYGYDKPYSTIKIQEIDYSEVDGEFWYLFHDTYKGQTGYLALEKELGICVFTTPD